MLCFLEGSIHQSNYGALIDRLKISSLSDPIPFKMREVCVTKQSGNYHFEDPYILLNLHIL